MFTIVPPPNVISTTPTSGVAGTQVTILGSSFGTTRGNGSVWLGSTVLGVHYLVAQLIATGLALLLSYRLNQAWSFA